MIKLTKKIILALILSLGFASSSWAILPLPEVYVGGAYVQKKSSADASEIKENFDTKSYLVSLGIRPINLPVLGNFRIEAQNLGAVSGQNKDSQYGLVLYYDVLRIIPFVNPYVGVGTQYATYKFDSEKKSKGLYTLHAGLTASLPALPLDLYAEYRYTTTSSKTKIGVTTYDIKSNDFMIGARYYIFK